jgi:hypothetical protein
VPIFPASLTPNLRRLDGMEGSARSEILSADEAPFTGVAARRVQAAITIIVSDGLFARARRHGEAARATTLGTVIRGGSVDGRSARG